MSIASVKQRIVDSAVEFALNAFWVALVGVIATAAAIGYAFWRGLSEKWLWAFSGSLATLIAVLSATSTLVWFVRKRTAKSRSVGRKGLFDFIRDRDRATTDLVRSLDVLNQETEKVGEQMSRKAAQMERANKAGSQRRSLRVARKVATLIERRALRMEVYVGRFSDSVDVLTTSTVNWLAWMKERKTPVQSDDFMTAIRGLRDATVGALPNVRSFKDMTRTTQDFSAEMDLAAGRLVLALDKLIAGMERTVAFCNQIIAEYS